MSLYVTLAVNSDPVGSVTISRSHGDGIDHDSVNEYQWRYMSGGELRAAGTLMHRYGDGAVALAASALKRCQHVTAAKPVDA